MKTTITAIALTAATATTAFADINMNKNNQCMEYNGSYSGNVNIHGNNSFLIDVKNTNQTCSSVMGVGGNNGADGKDGTNGIDGKDGTNGIDGKDGTNGTNGIDGKDGTNGIDGKDGAVGDAGGKGDKGDAGGKGDKGDAGGKGDKGDAGKDGKDGKDGRDAVTPLGSLSFAAASSSFYGDGIGFGLSDSNYGGLEGSFVLGKNLGGGWRTVVGLTTDFNKRHAASVGVGFSF
jgi:hypothetical protein